ncbi:MAG: Tfp pilus assembly protein PilF [Parcubacteria group bacterium]|jgi:tetratricopeptide (TPR) repeat protein|nr:Tfp pilus assembly protein PilF [Parcubacteria group bacterium]
MQTETAKTAVSVAPHPKRFSFDTLAIWALTLTIAVAAIAFIPVATIPFLYTKVSIIAIGGLIALVLFVLARLTRGNIIVPPIALIGALWLVPLAYALSMLFSGVGIMAGAFGIELEPDTFGFILILASFATLIALVFRRTNHYRTFFKVGGVLLAITLLSEVIFVIVGKLSPSTVSPTANLIGSFTDLGMVVGLGLICALLAIRFLALTSRVRIATWVFGALALFVLALVNAKLIWILVTLVALGLFIESIMKRRGQPEDEDLDGVATLEVPTGREATMGESRALAPALITIIVALFFIIGGNTIGAALSNALGTNFIDVHPSWQSTLAVGSHTYASSPLFGSGPGTFGEQWLKYRDPSLNDTIFWNVDFNSGIGMIPTSFVTTGILGVLAWLVFIGLFLFIGIRALLFRTPEDPYARFVSIASFVGSIYLFVAMIFSTPGPLVLLVGFFMVGLFVSSLRYSGTRREWGIVFAKNPRVGFVIVFGLTILLLASVVAAYTITERYLADVAYADGSAALAKGDLTGAATDVNRALLFAKNDRTYQLAAAIGIAQMNKIAADTTLAPSDAQQQFQAALSSSIQAATTAVNLDGKNYQNWEALASVYQTVVPLNLSGAYDKAKDAYTHAIALNPSSPVLPYSLAQLEIAQKSYTAAETDLTNAINLKHDYTAAIFLFSQLEVQQGKTKEALQAAEAAAVFAPTDPNVQFQLGILRSGNGDTDGSIVALMAAVKANPQYANALFFLAVDYATKNDFADAITQLNAIAALSPANATAVAPDLAQLKAGKNPFPPSRLGALGIPQTPIPDATKAPATAANPG